MHINHLSLTNFRIFKRLEIEFPLKLTLLIGNNAQGKTTILEALHFLSIMTSPLATSDREIVNFSVLENDLPVTRFIAHVCKDEKDHKIEMRLILTKTSNGIIRLRKEVLIDNSKKRLFDAVGFFPSVIFLPNMLKIIAGSPSDRRKYIDRTLSQAIPNYIRALSDYNQAISNRNALLKQILERNSQREQLLFWDKTIAENASFLIIERAKAIQQISTMMLGKHIRLSGGVEQLSLKYLPEIRLDDNKIRQLGSQKGNQEIEGLDKHQIEELLLLQLDKHREEEIRRGVTTIGPHRDDIAFVLNDQDLGVYGSRGQLRTALMSLKFAEISWLREKTQQTPILLLDETLAELDEIRRKDLLNELEKNSQAILTTTDPHLFANSFLKKCKVWYIKQGAIYEE